MDANRQRFWMLADESHWLAATSVEYDDRCRRIRLRDRRPRRPLPGLVNPSVAQGLLTTPAQAIDQVLKQRQAGLPVADLTVPDEQQRGPLGLTAH